MQKDEETILLEPVKETSSSLDKNISLKEVEV
jgi:hypothetical protein